MKSTKKPAKRKRAAPPTKQIVTRQTYLALDLSKEDPSTCEKCPICGEAYPGGKMKKKVAHFKECSQQYEEMFKAHEESSLSHF